MYCTNCGNFINDNSAYCPHCGAQQVAQYQNTQYQYVQYQYVPSQYAPAHNYSTEKTNTLAIIGFIFSFFVAIVGLICSIIGYKDAPKCGGNGKGLAVAGIIISILSMVSALILFIVIFVTYGSWLY